MFVLLGNISIQSIVSFPFLVPPHPGARKLAPSLSLLGESEIYPNILLISGLENTYSLNYIIQGYESIAKQESSSVTGPSRDRIPG